MNSLCPRYNPSQSRNKNIPYDDDPPLKLKMMLAAKFKQIQAIAKSKGTLMFYRESSMQRFPNFPVKNQQELQEKLTNRLQWLQGQPFNETRKQQEEAKFRRQAKSCESAPNMSMGGEFPDMTCSNWNGDWKRFVCDRHRSGTYLNFSQFVPYRWRERIAMSVVLEQGFEVVLPPWRGPPMTFSRPAQGASSTNSTVTRPQLLLHWIPWQEATMTRGDLFGHFADCTHPRRDPHLYGLIWDALAKHIIYRNLTLVPNATDTLQTLHKYQRAIAKQRESKVLSGR